MFFSRSTVKIDQDSSSSDKDNLINIEGLTDNTQVKFEEYQEMMNDNCIILRDIVNTEFTYKDIQDDNDINCGENIKKDEEVEKDGEEEVEKDGEEEEEDEDEEDDEEDDDEEDDEEDDEAEGNADNENTIYVISIDNQVRYYEKNLSDAKSKISKLIENYNNQGHDYYHNNFIHYKPKNTIDIIRNFDFWLFSINYPAHTFNITRLSK